MMGDSCTRQLAANDDTDENVDIAMGIGNYISPHCRRGWFPRRYNKDKRKRSEVELRRHQF